MQETNLNFYLEDLKLILMSRSERQNANTYFLLNKFLQEEKRRVQRTRPDTPLEETFFEEIEKVANLLSMELRKRKTTKARATGLVLFLEEVALRQERDLTFASSWVFQYVEYMIR